MTINKAVILGFFAFSLAVGAAKAQTYSSCENVVSEANVTLQGRGLNRINSTRELVELLKYMDKNKALPGQYMRSDLAKRYGWSGDDRGSLWSNPPTRGKLIGGDPFQHRSLPNKVNWLTVDIDVSRGYGRYKKLLYSWDSPRKFISSEGPDRREYFVEVSPCYWTLR